VYDRLREDRWRTGEISVLHFGLFLECAFGFCNLLLLGLTIPSPFKSLELFSLHIFRFFLYFGVEGFSPVTEQMQRAIQWRTPRIHSSTPFVWIHLCIVKMDMY